MAKRFRIDALPEEKRTQLKELVYKYFPEFLRERALDSIEQMGKIPDELFREGYELTRGEQFTDKGKADVTSRLASITQELPTKRSALESYLSQDVDEANLTDQEIQDRLQAYQELGKDKRTLDRASIEREVQSKLQQYGVTGSPDAPNSILNQAKKRLTDLIIEEGGYPSPEKIVERMGSIDLGLKGFSFKQTGDYTNLTNLAYDQRARNYFSNFITQQIASPEVAEDVKRLQDIVTARQEETGKTQAYEKFLAETPAELRSQREKYLAERQAAAGTYLSERIAPRVVSQLNVYGLAEGPDVGGVLASEASALQGNIEETARALEMEDNQFFADAAYNLTLAKLDMSEEAYRTQIAAERAGIRQKQGQRYETKETELQNQFALDALRREQDRALRLRKASLESGVTSEQQDYLATLTAQLGESAGKITAAKIAESSTPKEIG